MNIDDYTYGKDYSDLEQLESYVTKLKAINFLKMSSEIYSLQEWVQAIESYYDEIIPVPNLNSQYLPFMLLMYQVCHEGYGHDEDWLGEQIKSFSLKIHKANTNEN